MKTISKIVGAGLALAMALGIGVAASYSGKDTVRADAKDVTASWVASSGALGGSCSSSAVGATATGTITDSQSNTWSYTRTVKAIEKSTSSTNATWQGGTWIQLGANACSQELVLTTSAISGTVKSITVISATAGTHTLTATVGTTPYFSTETIATYSNAASATNPDPTGKGTNNVKCELTATGSATASSSNPITITITPSSRKAMLIRGFSINYDDGQASESHTISFEHGEGTGTMTSDSSNSGTYTFPSASSFTAPTNKILKGWRVGSTDYKLGDTYTFSTTTENITATALWIKDATNVDNPYTVAEARDAIDFNVGLNNIHISGTISQVDSYDSEHKSITYWISDDGTTANQFEVYSGKGLNGADFASVDDLSTGFEVVVKGTIKKYGNIYEFNYNSQIISLVDPAHQLISITIGGSMSKTSYYTDDVWMHDGLTATANYSSGDPEDITNDVTWSYDPLTPADMGASASSQQLTVTATYNSVSGSKNVSVIVSTPVTVSYGLVNSTSSLSVGDKVLILNFAEEYGIGLYADGGNNVSAKTITVSNHSVSSTSLGDVAVYTLCDASSVSTGLFYLQDKAGNFLYAAGSTKNYLKASSDASLYGTDGAWDIAINASGEATITAPESQNRNLMRYNPNSGTPIFSCYASDSTTGTSLAVYKQGHTPGSVKELSSLRVEGTPSKTSYYENDEFDPSGLTIYAVYTDSTTYPDEDVTDYVTWSPERLTLETESVIGSYTEETITKSCEITGITVNPLPQVETDKVLTTSGLGLSGSGYDSNNGPHDFDGETYTTSYVSVNNGFQFRGGSSGGSTLYNSTQHLGLIKTITLIMNSTNENTVHVGAGSSENPTSEVNPVSTYSTNGINVYNINANYFSIFQNKNGGVIHIDTIIVELVDSTSTALGNARTAAQKILTGLNGLCGESGSGLVTQAQWEAIATNVGTLDNDTKAILKGAVRVAINDLALGAATIENAMYHYDAVLAKFGYTDILEIGNSAAHTNTSPMIVNSETAVVIITVIAAISITSIGALLVLKKRKEQF